MDPDFEFPILVLREQAGEMWVLDDLFEFTDCEHPGPPVGPVTDSVVIDASGRTWRILAIRGVRLKGALPDRFSKWRLGLRQADYELEEGERLSWSEIRERVCALMQTHIAVRWELWGMENSSPLRKRRVLAVAQARVRRCVDMRALGEIVGSKDIVMEAKLRRTRRASRRDYWTITAPVVAGSIALAALLWVYDPESRDWLARSCHSLFAAAFLAFQWVALRRLRDIDLSGGWFFVALIGAGLLAVGLINLGWAPWLCGLFVLNFLVAGLIILGLIPGNTGPNRFGLDPRAPPVHFLADPPRPPS